MKAISTSKARASVLGAMLLILALAGCNKAETQGGGVDPSADILAGLRDPTVSQDLRLKRIAAEAREGNLAAVFPLIRVMKHQSQAAFLLEEDPSLPFGLRAVEFRTIPPPEHAIERVFAVAALEKIGSPMALPDLLLAATDIDDKVGCHVGRALVHLGCADAGMQILLEKLGKKAYANETACRMLRELSGREFGFSSDSGWAKRDAAAARWREWWRNLRSSGGRLQGQGPPYRLGMNPEADRRFRFFVDMAGQFQLKYLIDVRDALIRLGGPALPYLREAIEAAASKGNHSRRAALCQVLQTIDDPKSRELLTELLQDPHPTVRSRAVLALGHLGGKGVLESIKGGLKDGDASVVHAALRSLGLLPKGQGLETLRELHFADADREEIRTLALFVATRGKEMRSQVLHLLVDGQLPSRNRAHAAIEEVIGAIEYNPVAERKERAARAKNVESRLGS